MAFDEALAERIRRRLARRKNVEEKKMFGGIGFLLNGNILVGVWKELLIPRLGPDEADEALKEPHVKEFDITGWAMRGWVLVEPEGVEDDRRPRARRRPGVPLLLVHHRNEPFAGPNDNRPGQVYPAAVAHGRCHYQTQPLAGAGVDVEDRHPLPGLDAFQVKARDNPVV